MAGYPLTPRVGKLAVAEAVERPYQQAVDHLAASHGIRVDILDHLVNRRGLNNVAVVPSSRLPEAMPHPIPQAIPAPMPAAKLTVPPWGASPGRGSPGSRAPAEHLAVFPQREAQLLIAPGAARMAS